MAAERGIKLRGRWKWDEIEELKKILAPLPEATLEGNPHLHSIERQPVLTNAPASAPGHSKYEPLLGSIVVFDKGVYHGSRIDPEQFRRSVYHELAHSLLRGNPALVREWGERTRGDDFIDDYAKTSPDEDFCDTFSEFLIDEKRTADAVPRKAEFVRTLLSHFRSDQEEKVAMSFMRGFANELVKTAGPSMGRVARMFRRGEHAAEGAKGMTLGKGLLIGGGAAAGAGAIGEVLGKKRGAKEGYGAGTQDMMEVAEQSRNLGRREGILAYHDALQKKLQAAGPQQ